MNSETLRITAFVALLIALSSCGGCSQPRGEVFPELAAAPLWPPPPAPTRIEYVGAIASDRDLHARRSFAETLFGAEPARTMLTPYALCTDGANQLFVCDSNAQMVHVFDLDSREYASWQPTADGTPLAQPLGVAWDPERQRLIVADAGTGRLLTLDADGEVIQSWGADQLQRPCGLAIDPATDRLFVADPPAHAVVIFDLESGASERIGTNGSGPGEFNFPTNVAIGPDGALYVADSLNFSVQVFDRDLQPIGRIGSQGDQPGSFSQPKGVACDTVGHVYVVDAHFEAVQIFDGEGRLLLTFGREGGGPGEFWLPAGIWIDGRNRIWVADSYNRRVQVFQYVEETP